MSKIKMAIEEIFVAEFYVEVDETITDEDISDVAIEKAKTLYKEGKIVIDHNKPISRTVAVVEKGNETDFYEIDD